MSFLFSEPLKCYDSLYFTIFSMKSICLHVMQALKPNKLNWLSPLSKSFIKRQYFQTFHCHIICPLKLTGCSVFTSKLVLWHCSIIWTGRSAEFVRIICPSLFENPTITTNFLEIYIFSTHLVLKLIACLLFSTIKD